MSVRTVMPRCMDRSRVLTSAIHSQATLRLGPQPRGLSHESIPPSHNPARVARPPNRPSAKRQLQITTASGCGPGNISHAAPGLGNGGYVICPKDWKKPTMQGKSGFHKARNPLCCKKRLAHT
jgi:hypothetical protein